MTGSSEDVCVELVYDSDCPNVDQARANLRGALRAGMSGAPDVETIVAAIRPHS